LQWENLPNNEKIDVHLINSVDLQDESRSRDTFIADMSEREIVD
jgi:hypothetical protein